MTGARVPRPTGDRSRAVKRRKLAASKEGVFVRRRAALTEPPREVAAAANREKSGLVEKTARTDRTVRNGARDGCDRVVFFYPYFPAPTHSFPPTRHGLRDTLYRSIVARDAARPRYRRVVGGRRFRGVVTACKDRHQRTGSRVRQQVSRDHGAFYFYFTEGSPVEKGSETLENRLRIPRKREMPSKINDPFGI